MRYRWIIGVMAFVVILALLMLVSLTKEKPLTIAMGPVTYQRLRSGDVAAMFIVTNTSDVAIEFRQFYDGQMRVEDSAGWKQSRVPLSPILEAATIIEPKKTSTNRIWLPAEFRRWQVGYKARSPSARARAWRILPRKVSARFRDVIARSLSDKSGKDEEVWGEVIDATSWITANAKAPNPMEAAQPREAPKVAKPRFWETMRPPENPR
jgi:hypothetical protein